MKAMVKIILAAILGVLISSMAVTGPEDKIVFSGCGAGGMQYCYKMVRLRC